MPEAACAMEAMRVVIPLAQHGLRRRAGSWAVVAAAVAAAGAGVLGCIARASRTASAHPPFLRATNAADVGFASDPHCGERPCTAADFAGVDGVVHVARFVRLLAAHERADGSIDPTDDVSTMLGLSDGT